MMKYEFLSHTADAEFIAYGKSLACAFSNAMDALYSLILEHSKVRPEFEKEIEVSGSDTKGLLYAFLEELLFLIDSESYVASKAESIKISSNRLKARLLGEKMSDRHRPHGEVKAVTYNRMEVGIKNKLYYVRVVVDM